MATVTSNQNAMQPATHGLSGNVKAWWGKYTYGTAPSQNDLFNICKLPKNSLALMGWVMTDDIDTGTEALDIDIGWTANGGASATFTDNGGTIWTNAAGSGDDDGLVNGGVFTGDAITDLMAAGMNMRPFLFGTGPKYFSEETQIQGKIVAAANAGGTGTVYVLILGLAL
jgi:hypothetical protein